MGLFVSRQVADQAFVTLVISAKSEQRFYFVAQFPLLIRIFTLPPLSEYKFLPLDRPSFVTYKSHRAFQFRLNIKIDCGGTLSFVIAIKYYKAIFVTKLFCFYHPSDSGQPLKLHFMLSLYELGNEDKNTHLEKEEKGNG